MAKIELFIGGCRMCSTAVKMVEEASCPSCTLDVYDLREGHETEEGLERAKHYGVHQVPAVAIDGKILDGEMTIEKLKAAGVGSAK